MLWLPKGMMKMTSTSLAALPVSRHADEANAAVQLRPADSDELRAVLQEQYAEAYNIARGL